MSWVHDNEIISYTVDVEKETIMLQTKYEANAVHDVDEKTVVEFTGVIAHQFDEVTYQNVIYDIYQFPLERFLEDNKDVLDSQYRRNSNMGYSWPVWCKSKQEMLEKLRTDRKAYFCIDSVIGLSVWVLAEAVTITVNGEPKPLS